jgi:hypothetical protein
MVSLNHIQNRAYYLGEGCRRPASGWTQRIVRKGVLRVNGKRAGCDRRPNTWLIAVPTLSGAKYLWAATLNAKTFWSVLR